MSTTRYRLTDAFSIRSADGAMLIFPPGDALVGGTSCLLTFALNRFDPVLVGPGEIDRLVAQGVAVRQ